MFAVSEVYSTWLTFAGYTVDSDFALPYNNEANASGDVGKLIIPTLWI